MITLLFAPTHGQPVEKPTPLKAIDLNIAHLIVVAEKPDYDKNVLVPLRAAQAKAAQEAARRAQEAAAAQRAIEVARAAQTAAAQAVGVPKNISVTLPPGSHTDWMIAAGIDAANFGYVDYIVSHESGWRWWITNNEGSGATGLGQALPASKMAPFGVDYLTNPITQLRWAQAYAIARYGSWAAAYQYWAAHRVW